jgi:hypothetical protein
MYTDTQGPKSSLFFICILKEMRSFVFISNPCKNAKIQPEKVIWRKLLLNSPHKIQIWFAIHLQTMRKKYF